MMPPEFDMTTFDLGAVTHGLEKLPRVGSRSINSGKSISLGELGDDELDSTPQTSVHKQPSPHSIRQPANDEHMRATTLPSINGNLGTSNGSVSTIKPSRTTGEGKDSESVVSVKDARSEVTAIKDSKSSPRKKAGRKKSKGARTERRVVKSFSDAQYKETAVEDSQNPDTSQQVVERNWEADRVANRGLYDTTTLSHKKRFAHWIFTAGGKTLHLKRTVMNAVLFGVALRILRDVLIALGVRLGWLYSTIQDARISKESILEMQSSLESHFRKPRTGGFDRSHFCQIVRVITWVLAEVRDDLHALMSSSYARDDVRGHLYRARLVEDWSLRFPPMLRRYDIVLNGAKKSSVIVKYPLKAVSHAQFQAKSRSHEKSRQKGQKGSGDVMGEEAADSGLITALANFWFGALHIHANLRRAREQHTVLTGQPSPYTVTELQKVPNMLRWKLKERCLDVNHALVRNIELILAEIRASIDEEANQPWQQLVARRKQQVDDRMSQAALTYLESIQQGLRQDLADIEALFIDGQVTDRDVDILLFYNGLRTHSWNNRWYGITREEIVDELNRRPGTVMRQAYNVGHTVQDDGGAPE